MPSSDTAAPLRQLDLDEVDCWLLEPVTMDLMKMKEIALERLNNLLRNSACGIEPLSMEQFHLLLSNPNVKVYVAELNGEYICMVTRYDMPTLDGVESYVKNLATDVRFGAMGVSDMLLEHMAQDTPAESKRLVVSAPAVLRDIWSKRGYGGGGDRVFTRAVGRE